MRKFMEHIDEIFEALYGSITNNSNDYDNVKYSKIYDYEVQSMIEDYTNYLKCMSDINIKPVVEDIAKFIIYTEYVHIGNETRVKENLNVNKLKEVASKLI
jgi:hypothetical protein